MEGAVMPGPMTGAVARIGHRASRWSDAEPVAMPPGREAAAAGAPETPKVNPLFCRHQRMSGVRIGVLLCFGTSGPS